MVCQIISEHSGFIRMSLVFQIKQGIGSELMWISDISLSEHSKKVYLTFKNFQHFFQSRIVR